MRETFWQITQKLWAQRPDTVYILVFYNISFPWLLPLDGFQFIFLLCDSENDVYIKSGSNMRGGRQSGLMIGCIFFCCLLVDEPITGVGRYL